MSHLEVRKLVFQYPSNIAVVCMKYINLCCVIRDSVLSTLNPPTRGSFEVSRATLSEVRVRRWMGWMSNKLSACFWSHQSESCQLPKELSSSTRHKVNEREVIDFGNIKPVLIIVLIISLNNAHIPFTYMPGIKAFYKLSWSHFKPWVSYTKCLYYNRQIFFFFLFF